MARHFGFRRRLCPSQGRIAINLSHPVLYDMQLADFPMERPFPATGFSHPWGMMGHNGWHDGLKSSRLNLCFVGTGKRGHYERGLFTGGISRISKISKFSRISRKWSDSPLFSTVWGFSRSSRISKFSRISRKWTFLKRPLFQKTPFPEPDFVVQGSRSLKTLTSLIYKEVRPFFLCDNSIWSLPSVSSLTDYSIWSSWRLFYPCDHSIWSIWAHCPQILLSLRKKGKWRSLDSLFKEVTVFKGFRAHDGPQGTQRSHHRLLSAPWLDFWRAQAPAESRPLQ